VKAKYAIHLTLCVATIAFAIALVFPALFPTSVLWYQPAERQWTFDVKASGVSIDFYGRCLLAALASCLAALATYLVARRFLRRDPSGRLVALFTVSAITFIVLAITFTAWRLAHRIPDPPLTPAWYQPR
jgi:hypothetical protein